MNIIMPIVLGVFIVVFGIFIMRGNISSIHWYHRRRVSEENRLAFGRLVGGGTVIEGISLILYSLLLAMGEMLKTGVCAIIGGVIIIVGLIIGLGISFYGMIKYNKGIF